MKVAIVGAGQIAEAHIGEVMKIQSVELVALCDLLESPLLALKEKYAIPSTYTDFSILLEKMRPDVVHITTPPGSHLFLAKQAIEAGAHVYIEKPLTVTYAETEELIAFAEGHNKKVCIGTNYFYSRAQQHATKRIVAGELGDITHIDSFFSYDLQGIFGRQVTSNPDHWIAKLPGQIFQNNLNHPLAPIVPYLSDDFSVRAWADDWTGNGVVFEELRAEIIDHKNKLTAYVVFSSNVKPGAFRVSYYGTKKAFFINNHNHTVIEDQPATLPGTLGQILMIRKVMKSLSRQFWANLGSFVFGKKTFFSDMNELFQDFYRAINENKDSPIPVADLRKASKIIEEINRQIGRPAEDNNESQSGEVVGR